MGLELPLRGIAAEWADLFCAASARRHCAEALQLSWPLSDGDEAVLAAAGDLGLTVAKIVTIDRLCEPCVDDPNSTARQWRFAMPDESGTAALILPVSLDPTRHYYAPGQVPISIHRLGTEIFFGCICDLVAIPLAGGVPLSMTGLTLAVGRFAVRERGELEIFASGMSWLRAHLARAREMADEMPGHLVPDQLDTPDHFCTLLLEPRAIDWRPHSISCAFPRGTKNILVRDSAGLAAVIDTAMRQKEKLPPMPKVFGPKAGA